MDHKKQYSKVALVTGASRGAGRGIATELALAGHKVYITGRSRTSSSTTEYDLSTLDQTQQIIHSLGGLCEIIECDHNSEQEIEHVFERIAGQEETLDVLVNNVWAGYVNESNHVMGEKDNFQAKFWDQPLYRWDNMFHTSLRSHFLCSQHAARMMIEKQSGLIVTTGFWDDDNYFDPVPYNVVKHAKVQMAYGMAIDLKEYNVASVMLSLGWVRTEHLLSLFEVDEESYRTKEELCDTESPRYAGRAIVALSNDSNIMSHTGKVVRTAEMAEIYDFDDIDGLRPKIFHIGNTSKGITKR